MLETPIERGFRAVDKANDAPFTPVTCRNMEEIRTQIDRMDRMIVPLLAERLNYVAQAAQFKPTRADVVVPWRIEDVVAKAKARAREVGMDEETVETVYRALVDAYIAHEAKEWDRLRVAGDDSAEGPAT